MGNLKSVKRGLEKVGASAIVSSDPVIIATAERLILPGVGAFEDGMRGLEDAGVISAVNDFVKTGNELLGICLGMQMLLDQSEEYGNHKGLGLISGDVKEIPKSYHGKPVRKIPHIGWIGLEKPSHQDWRGTCLEDIKVGDFFLFCAFFYGCCKKSREPIGTLRIRRGFSPSRYKKR
jgi:glutamine amidotransferase